MRSFEQIEIKPLQPEQIDAYSMLWQFYLYHQSDFMDDDIGVDGKFDIDDSYLNDIAYGREDCDAHLIYFSQSLAGFINVEQTEISGLSIPELSDIFILPKYRQHGITSHVVKSMFIDKYPRWHVAVYGQDLTAKEFWERLFKRLAVKDVSKLPFSESGEFNEYIVSS